MDELIKQEIITKESTRLLLENNIRFVEGSVLESGLRHMYNAVDLYISPYLAEGFNMMVLEAIACGTRVLVSKGGSTDDFIEELLSIKDSQEYIYRFDTETISNSGKKQLTYSLDSILKELTRIDFKKNSDDYLKGLVSMIHKRYPGRV
jgi:glycosyltransferase involved in cell wall biosynthesis